MSRQIDTSDPSSLTEEDIQYLQDRGIPLPEGVDPVPADEPEPIPLSEVPNIGDVGTVPDDTLQPLAADQYGMAGLPALRAELGRRGLSTDGNKKALIARLEESDDPVMDEGDDSSNDEE